MVTAIVLISCGIQRTSLPPAEGRSTRGGFPLGTAPAFGWPHRSRGRELRQELPGLGPEDGNEAAHPDVGFVFLALLRRQLALRALIGESIDPVLRLPASAELY